MVLSSFGSPLAARWLNPMVGLGSRNSCSLAGNLHPCHIEENCYHTRAAMGKSYHADLFFLRPSSFPSFLRHPSWFCPRLFFLALLHTVPSSKQQQSAFLSCCESSVHIPRQSPRLTSSRLLITPRLKQQQSAFAAHTNTNLEGSSWKLVLRLSLVLLTISFIFQLYRIHSFLQDGRNS